MNLKARIAKLEEIQAQQRPKPTAESEEASRKLLNDLIRSINEGTHKRVSTELKPPPPPDAGPSTLFTYNILRKLSSEP